MNAALLVSSDGTHFCGWQIQKNGVSVQGELERAIFEAFGIRVRVTGSGRTDAGVHAAGQVCNFPLDDGIRILPWRIADALNVFLPPAVRVLESAAAPDLFDACRSAKRKTYRYALYFSEREKPLLERYAARVAKKPDLGKMRACAELLEGEHDFSSFSSTGSSAKTSVRTVYSVLLSDLGNGAHIDVCGNGFLYNMVRIMAGAIVGCGLGRLSLQTVKDALFGGGRDLLGQTMPAKGLTLLGVDYGFPLFGAKGNAKE